MRRRDALIFGSICAVAIAIPPVLRRLPSTFEFEALSGFPGFRRLQGGEISGGIDPFFGLGETGSDVPSAASLPDMSPCHALFGPGGWPENKVPIAMFSDFNCPYCKVLEARILELRDSGTPLKLTWHEMPLLGPSSQRYAQAALAGRFLGVAEQARAHLSSNPLRPGPVALRQLADELGVDGELYVQEAMGDRVARTIQRSIALGRALGIPGTPGTMIGRTLVIGAISPADLGALIDLEAREPQAICT